MNKLLKKDDNYVDAEEAGKVTKNLREGCETESHKRKIGDERKPVDKDNPRNERINRGTLRIGRLGRGERRSKPSPL